MKKLFFSLFAVCVICSCGSDATSNATPDAALEETVVEEADSTAVALDSAKI